MRCKDMFDYTLCKFYTVTLFNLIIFHLSNICSAIIYFTTEIRSVDSYTFHKFSSKSLTSILPCWEIQYPLSPRPLSHQHIR